MNEREKWLYDHSRIALRKLAETAGALSFAQIAEVVNKYAIAAPHLLDCGDVQPLEQDRVVRRLQSEFNILVEEGFSVIESKHDHEEWLDDAKVNKPWPFWLRYHDRLEQNMPMQVIEKLDTLTDEILGRLERPQREGPWARIGLVVGNVQSGKTANYAGLINKAIDAGYRVIIVLAGTHNSLRSQTQLRLDHDVIGIDTSREDEGSEDRVGVGLINPSLTITSLTNRTEHGDFSHIVDVDPRGNDPIILVIKKNGSILRRVKRWLDKYAVPIDSGSKKKHITDCPLLIIDDEADNASVDSNAPNYDEVGTSSRQTDPTRINGLIRKILNLFDKRAYVGYTATPFANLFIYPELQEGAANDEYGMDLFPESFIINLPAPDNYMGPIQVFGLREDLLAGIPAQAPYPLVREREDYRDVFPSKHDKDWTPPQLPPSLQEAIRAFLLVVAARRVRGDLTAHNSMLIHVTRYVAVQGEVAELVKAEVESLRNRLRYGDGKSSNLLDELQALWESDFRPTTEEMKTRADDVLITDVSWDAVATELKHVADSIKIREINGRSGDALEYHKHRETGLTVITIGGDKLSRGLTLEGLSISYYLRTSNMYDTLLQMGRWFGYRPGYLDLCRLYLSPVLRVWYCHITLAYEELRQEFDRMVKENRTPREYGLKVRTHPAGLRITAANKMRNTRRFMLSYADTIVETYAFHKDPMIKQKNLAVIERWVQNIGNPSDSDDDRSTVWMNIPVEQVLALLHNIIIHPDVRSCNQALLKTFIERQTEHGLLTDWIVALISSGKNETHRMTLGGIEDIGLTYRRDTTREDATKYTLSRNRLIDPKDEGIGLTEEQKATALILTNSWRPEGAPAAKTASGQAYRHLRGDTGQGLLLIYPVTPIDQSASQSGESDVSVPFVGLALSFPRMPNGMPIQYDANVIFSPGDYAVAMEDGE